ncbi:hypothetical protein TNCV_3043001 [Trichonephila clavipes]|nr:hypothetical protein TNCV_3043001 [Trichonephila clavipes]
MIVLSWIRKESYQLKTFVANRIATIQEITSSEQWRYVATEDNPADFVSRGMDFLKLKTCELWWNGPKFLMSNQYPQRQIPVAVIKDPGRSITSIVEPDLTNLNENRLDNWQKITKIIQLIWKRWSVDYLNSLKQRNKWHFEKKNAKIGDMVIIKEDNLPSCQWSLGRINIIYPGKDSKGLGSNPGEDMNVCKCILPSRQGCTLNSRQAASPLVRLVEGEERWDEFDHPPECSPSKLRWDRVKSYCHLYGAQSYV